MKKIGVIRILFLLAAAYDGLLGLAFLAAPLAVFAWASVTPPNHPGYVQFPAALLIVFALMFLAVARDPVREARLIPYGMLLKVAYVGILGWHWMIRGIPYIWKPFVGFDLVFLGLFVWAWLALRAHATRSA